MLELFVNELTCGDKFIVTQACMQGIPLILGRAWQMHHNCFFNWEKRLAHCQKWRQQAMGYVAVITIFQDKYGVAK